MSSIDQAFIKAFARRNRSSQPASTTTAHSNATSGKPSAGATSLPSTAKTGTHSQNDFLRIDPNVESSVEIWPDQNEPRLVRVDSLESDPVPAPHAVPKPRKPEPKSPENQADSSIIAIDAAESASKPHIDLSTQIEKTTLHVRSIQESLDLLQSSFTTLETFQQPSDDITHLYVTDATADSLAKRLEPAPETETYDFASDEEIEQPEIVQRRIDSPSGYSVSSRDGAKTSSQSQDDGFGLTSVAAGSLTMRPVWEVDVFDVPSAVADLFFDGPLFQQIAERILQAVNSGLTSMMVSSVHRGEGRSTVAIGMAMAAAAAGLRVALIDADTEDPTLQDDLRLDLEYGWVDTVRGGLSIREVAVHAVEDGVTLVPLMPPTAGSTATDFEIAQVLQSLRGKFDLIVVDTPSLESSMNLPVAAMVDSALIVRDASRTDADMINKLSYKLRENGVQGIGVVDNFS